MLDELEKLEIARRAAERGVGEAEIRVHVEPLTDEARHDGNGACVAGEARGFGAEERGELARGSQRHLAESGVGRLVPEHVAQVLGERARVRLVARERRGTKQEIRIQERGAHQRARCVLGGDAGRLELASRAPTNARARRRRAPAGRGVRGARGSYFRRRSSALARGACRKLGGDDERREVFAREQVRMEPDPGETALFDVNGPMRPSTGTSERSASSPNADSTVARYSARVSRE